MDVFSVVIIAVGLAMDAFAVSVASGVAIQEQKVRHAVRIALFFGGFQAAMPLVGWLAGSGLRGLMQGVSHWVAFALLTVIGCKMIYEAVKLEPAARKPSVFGVSTLLALSIATSLDALVVGVSLSLLHVAIVTPIIVIGLVTFTLSLLGVFIGDRFGHLFESRVEVAGGLVLIAIGIKILLEHFL